MEKYELNIGIYKITNSKNGKSYIGGSSNIKQRFIEHYRGANRGYHENRDFQTDWDKYGPNSFVFEVLLYCRKDNLIFFEQRAIESHRVLSSEYGYNCFPALAGMPLGSNHINLMARRTEDAKRRRVPKKKMMPRQKKKVKGKKKIITLYDFPSPHYRY